MYTLIGSKNLFCTTYSFIFLKQVRDILTREEDVDNSSSERDSDKDEDKESMEEDTIKIGKYKNLSFMIERNGWPCQKIATFFQIKSTKHNTFLTF